MFAQDQVSELPPPATPAPIEAPIAEIRGNSHEDLIAELVDLATEIDYTVQISDIGPADGSCNSTTRTIKLSERLEPNGQLVALIHELAHALVSIDPDAPKLDYAQGELVAESVAWCCCDTVGLDTSANSIPYLAGWAENASLEVLEQTAQMTSRLAARIEAALLADPAALKPAEQELVDAPQPVAVS